jgi:hypothetical protein
LVINNIDVVVGSLALIGAGLSAMVIRDYRTMKRVTRKDKNSDQFLLNLDSHDPTPYGKLLGINNEGEGSEQSED